MVITEKQRGFLIILVGPGGAGKNAILEALLKDTPGLKKLVTATTRPKRDHEIDEHDHYFVSNEQFQTWVRDGKLLEHTEVTRGKWYGIIREKVDEALDNGIDLIADIDIKGAEVLMKTYPNDVVPVFITAAAKPEEAVEILRQRMTGRGEDTRIIQERIQRALELEFPFAERYEQQLTTIVNSEGQIEESIQTIRQIIRREREKRGRPS